VSSIFLALGSVIFARFIIPSAVLEMEVAAGVSSRYGYLAGTMAAMVCGACYTY
jgi:hypothetical protein